MGPLCSCVHALWHTCAAHTQAHRLTMAQCCGPACAKPASSMCQRCKASAYCSRECQAADWPQHKALCKEPSAESAKLAALMQSVLRKWGEQGNFIRFMDGNTQNSAVNNLRFVTLRDCLQPSTVDAWRADWDMNLTKEEEEVVRNPTFRAGLLLARLPGDAEPAAAPSGGRSAGK